MEVPLLTLRELLQIKNIRLNIFKNLDDVSIHRTKYGVVPCKKNAKGELVPMLRIAPLFSLRELLQFKNIRELIFKDLNNVSRYCTRLGVVPCKKNEQGEMIPMMYVAPFNNPLCYKCDGFIVGQYDIGGIRRCDFCGVSGHTTCLKREKLCYLSNSMCEHGPTAKYSSHRGCFDQYQITYCDKDSNVLSSVIKKRKKDTMVITRDQWKELRSKFISKLKDVTHEQLVNHRLEYDLIYKKKKEDEERKRQRQKENEEHKKKKKKEEFKKKVEKEVKIKKIKYEEISD